MAGRDSPCIKGKGILNKKKLPYTTSNRLTISILFSSFCISDLSSLRVFSFPCCLAKDDAHAEWIALTQFSNSICDVAWNTRNAIINKLCAILACCLSSLRYLLALLTMDVIWLLSLVSAAEEIGPVLWVCVTFSLWVVSQLKKLMVCCEIDKGTNLLTATTSSNWCSKVKGQGQQVF